MLLLSYITLLDISNVPPQYNPIPLPRQGDLEALLSSLGGAGFKTLLPNILVHQNQF